MVYHTSLKILLEPIHSEVENLTWLISDLEYSFGYLKDLPVNHQDDYFLLSPQVFKTLVDADPQIIWGAILGFAKHDIAIDKNDLPFVEGNDLIWKAGNIQHPDAVVEIDCFDSGYTIIKFKDHHLSEKFRRHFTEVIDLEKF